MNEPMTTAEAIAHLYETGQLEPRRTTKFVIRELCEYEVDANDPNEAESLFSQYGPHMPLAGVVRRVNVIHREVNLADRPAGEIAIR